MVNCPGERRPLKAISNLRVSANHELVIHAFEPKLLPPIINALNQLGGYKLERSTSDEAYFSLLLMTRETKDKFIREVKVIGVEAKVALNLVRQEIRDLVKKNKEFSQDQKRNYENQIDKITKIYQDKINAAEEKKIQELNL
ncbi:5545_t:CDS:1 [Funneliformis geosporum]|uniref:5545_t:CDS:1 n=1 Tax=Funneliformis geosporum TaxID=1117311 RepID=A0A9W4SAL8_9GLOM|nr:5545_t:CDS:1 [Funneliformis geosporum]